MNISFLSYKYRMIFWTAIVLLMFGGTFAYMNLSKLEDPELRVMQAMVVTLYPGGSAEEVEAEVTSVLEQEIRTIPYVKNVVSKSQPNVSQMSIMLDIEIPQDYIEQTWDILRRKVSAAQAKLPAGAMESKVMDDFGDVYGMFYALSGKGYTYDDLSKYANFIKRELLAIDGIKRVEIVGSQDLEVDITLSQQKLSQLGIYPAEIVLQINTQAGAAYAGEYEQNGNNMRIVVDSRLHSIDDIRNIVIKGFDNDFVRLGDIATVELCEPEDMRFALMYNGERALGIAVSMQSGVNVIDIGKAASSRIDNLMKRIPVGVNIDKVFFQPEKVKIAIDDFMLNLVMSVLTVVLVLMLTMGWRQGMILGAGLVITIVASFPILFAMGGTLQRVSLGAFVVAMGMLVDNAIVVMDNITVSLQERRGLKYSLFETPKKTMWALLGATGIAVTAFLPVYLSPDISGTYVGDLFVVLCISLTLSWVLALTQVPVFAAQMLPLRKISSGKQAPFDTPFFKWFEQRLRFLLSHRWWTIGVGAVLLATALFCFKFTKRTFFPDFNYNQAYIEMTLPQGTSINNVRQTMKNVSDDLMKMKGVTAVTASHGMTPTRYCLVRSLSTGGDNYAEFIVEFKNYKTMRRMKKSIEDYFWENHPGCYSRFRLYNLSIVASHTVEVEFKGPDLDVLRDLEQQAEAIMRKNKHIDHRTICSSMSNPHKSLVAHYSRLNAGDLGTQRVDVSNTLLAATDGLPVGTMWCGDVSHPIKLKLRNENGERIDDLNNLPVWNIVPKTNALNDETFNRLLNKQTSIDKIKSEIISPIPLSQIVDSIEVRFEETIINRDNGQRVVEAQCNPLETSSPADVRSEILDEIEGIELPEGYSMEWKGEHYLSTMAMKNIIRLLPIAAIFILLILVVLFNDLKNTFIVIICLPFAAIGIVPGLLVFNQPFSFVAIVGTIGMAGMLLKNSIVLIDEIENLKKAGMTKSEAIVQSTVSRLRPVMMASLTTILGMIPLIPDPMYGALAVTVMCGLLIGTIITLFLLPVMYSLMHRK